MVTRHLARTQTNQPNMGESMATVPLEPAELPPTSPAAADAAAGAGPCRRPLVPLPPPPGARADRPRPCRRCGGRGPIRVHFDRDCARARGDHFHRRCPCGHEWIERCHEGAPPGSVLNPYVATPVDG